MEASMDAAEERIARSFLRKCAAVYEALVAHVLRLEPRGDDERTLKWLSLAAEIAWTAHPGRFADGRLEAAALRIGRKLEGSAPEGATQPAAVAPAKKGRRVLHVATTVYETGGHTRLIENWIKNDGDAVHSLALLDQGLDHVRGALAELVVGTGGELIVFPDTTSLLERARRLRRVAQAGYGCLVLHHHPNDVVPLVALAAPDCPPVAVMNHADHVFWIGASVADAIVDFRRYGQRLSRERRCARETLLFPLPLDLPAEPLKRDEARARLGIPDAQVMLLSIGTAYKYTPTKRHDFFRAARRVLAENPQARLYIIGVGEEQFRAFGVPRHERIELLGIVADPSPYEAAADLYLESFPYGSYTALIETTARGVCPVLMYAPSSHTDISNDVPLDGLVASPRDEADYVARVSALIEDREKRTKLGAAVARQVLSIHGGDLGRIYLQPIYERLAATEHQFSPIPTLPEAETEDDLTLAYANSARIRTAVLAHIWDKTIANLTVGELLRLFAISLRTGDTRPTPAHVKGWLSVVKRKALAARRRT